MIVLTKSTKTITDSNCWLYNDDIITDDTRVIHGSIKRYNDIWKLLLPIRWSHLTVITDWWYLTATAKDTKHWYYNYRQLLLTAPTIGKPTWEIIYIIYTYVCYASYGLRSILEGWCEFPQETKSCSDGYDHRKERCSDHVSTRYHLRDATSPINLETPRDDTRPYP